MSKVKVAAWLLLVGAFFLVQSRCFLTVSSQLVSKALTPVKRAPLSGSKYPQNPPPNAAILGVRTPHMGLREDRNCSHDIASVPRESRQRAVGALR